MSPPSETTQAVEELQAVGLTEYEAKCFVTLSRISSGTAKDVGEVGDIPRSRVYDLAERLQEQGLIEIQDGSPRKFRAVSPTLAVEKLKREFLDHLDAVAEALNDLPKSETGNDGSGVWTVEGTANVCERGRNITSEADEEVFVLLTEDALIEDECRNEVHDAIERGVEVIMGSPNESLRSDLAEQFPAAVIWEPSLNWQTLPADSDQVSRLVMGDRESVMIATKGEERLPGVYEESAIWGKGPANGLVIVMRQMIGTHLDQFATTDLTSETQP